MRFDYSMDVIVEAQKEQIDYYYSILKRKGLYDYVSEIIYPEIKEEGIRLDTEMNYPLTVTTENISVINVSELINKIKLLDNDSMANKSLSKVYFLCGMGRIDL